MKKICTSLEQSKKLIKLGIDITTADMFWHRKLDGTHDLKINDIILKLDTPAWSLSALLELIHNSNYMLHNSNVGTDRYNIWIPQRKNPVWSETPLDAAFEIVCWLKENNILQEKNTERRI